MLNCSCDTITTIGDYAVKENKCFMMNLSAPYLSSLFKVLFQSLSLKVFVFAVYCVIMIQHQTGLTRSFPVLLLV